MRAALKRVGFGIVLWAVCYALAIPLLPLSTTDPYIFKTLVMSIGAIAMAVLTALYFAPVTERYLRESILLSATWVVVNWALDIVALLPFTHQTLPQYFMEIGLQYIAFTAPIVATGWLLDRHVARTG